MHNNVLQGLYNLPRKELYDVPGDGACGAHAQIVYLSIYLYHRNKLLEIVNKHINLWNKIINIDRVTELSPLDPDSFYRSELFYKLLKDNNLHEGYQDYLEDMPNLKDIKNPEGAMGIKARLMTTKNKLTAPFNNAYLNTLLNVHYNGDENLLLEGCKKTLHYIKNQSWHNYTKSNSYHKLFKAHVDTFAELNKSEAFSNEFKILYPALRVENDSKIAALREEFYNKNREIRDKTNFSISSKNWLTGLDSKAFLDLIGEPIDYFGIELNNFGRAALNPKGKSISSCGHWTVLIPITIGDKILNVKSHAETDIFIDQLLKSMAMVQDFFANTDKTTWSNLLSDQRKVTAHINHLSKLQSSMQQLNSMYVDPRDVEKIAELATDINLQILGSISHANINLNDIKEDFDSLNKSAQFICLIKSLICYLQALFFTSELQLPLRFSKFQADATKLFPEKHLVSCR